MKLLEAGAKQPGGGRSRGGRSRAWQRSRRHWLAFRLLAMAATLIEAKLPAASTAELGGPPPRLILTIQVFNYAKVSPGKLRSAEGEAGRIIGEAGVETVWLDCLTSRRVSLPAPGGDQQECSGEPLGATVILRVLNRSDYNSATFNREVFGYADGPALASVLYDRVAAFAGADGDMNEAAVILGDAMHTRSVICCWGFAPILPLGSCGASGTGLNCNAPSWDVNGSRQTNPRGSVPPWKPA